MGMDVPLPCLLTNPTRTTHTGSESVEKFETVDSLVMHENENEGGDENNDENDNENENENENENDNEESGDMTNGYRIGGDIISDSINSSNVLMGDGDYNKCQSLTIIQYNNNTTDYQNNNGGIGNGNDNVKNVNEFRVQESDNMGHSVVQALQREGEEETKKEERKDHVTDQMQQEREIFGQNGIVYDVRGNATSTSTASSSASVSAIDDRGGVHFNSLTGMHVYHIF